MILKKLKYLVYFLFINLSFLFASENDFYFKYGEEKKVIYADLNGDMLNEKVVISEVIDPSKKRIVINLYIFEKDKLVFSYNNFLEGLPIIYLKVVRFELGEGKRARDILFLIVGDCEYFTHMVSYERKSGMDGTHKKESYKVTKFVAQIESCY